MKLISSLLISGVFLMMAACGGSDTAETPGRSAASGAQPAAAQFSDFELEHGIGPVTERIELGPIVQAWVDQGRTIYEMKCEMCHSMNTRMVGPALGDVMERRSAEFVMNMILNPNEMAQQHPEGRAMLQQYMTVMPYQNVQYDEARAIVEYLRTVSAE
jgi:cytochrome c5